MYIYIYVCIYLYIYIYIYTYIPTYLYCSIGCGAAASGYQYFTTEIPLQTELPYIFNNNICNKSCVLSLVHACVHLYNSCISFFNICK